VLLPCWLLVFNLKPVVANEVFQKVAQALDVLRGLGGHEFFFTMWL
jgi:hypothetical protein